MKKSVSIAMPSAWPYQVGFFAYLAIACWVGFEYLQPVVAVLLCLLGLPTLLHLSVAQECRVFDGMLRYRRHKVILYVDLQDIDWVEVNEDGSLTLCERGRKAKLRVRDAGDLIRALRERCPHLSPTPTGLKRLNLLEPLQS